MRSAIGHASADCIDHEHGFDSRGAPSVTSNERRFIAFCGRCGWGASKTAKRRAEIRRVQGAIEREAQRHADKTKHVVECGDVTNQSMLVLPSGFGDIP